MELKSKKYIKNTGKLPGYDIGKFEVPDVSEWYLRDKYPSAEIIGWSNEKGPIFGDSNFVSPAKMIQDELNKHPQYAGYAKDTIAGPVYTGDDPYTNNSALVPGEQKDPVIGKNKRNDKLSFDTSNLGGMFGSAVNAGVYLANSFKSPIKHESIVEEAPINTNYVMGIPYVNKSFVTNRQRSDYSSLINANILGNMGNFGALGESIGGSLTKNGNLPKSKCGSLPKYFSGNPYSLMGGALGTGVGAILGGWAASVASGKLDKEIEIANRTIAGENEYNSNYAKSLGIQNISQKQNGDTRNLQLYKCGKLPKHAGGKNIATAYGPAPVKQDAWVSPKERIMDINTGYSYEIPGKKNKKDNIPAGDTEDKLILSAEANNIYKETGDLTAAIAYDERNRQLMKNNKKLPKNSRGTGYHTGANLAGLGLSAALYLSASGQDIKRPNTYVRNQGLLPGLRELGALRVSSYPILPELYNQYAKSMYAISNSGGLSGGQRTLARLSALNNLQNNYAKLLQSNQIQNNQYRAQYGDALLKYGAQDAQDRMNAMRYDLDYYSKAHAAKQNMMNTAMQNGMTFLQKQAADDFKWNTYQDTLGLYRQQLNNEQAKTAADIENMIATRELAKLQNKALFVNPYAFQGPIASFGMIKPFYNVS